MSLIKTSTPHKDLSSELRSSMKTSTRLFYKLGLPSRAGIVTSPNHPMDYNVNEQCAWEIRGGDGSTVNINFETDPVGTDSEGNPVMLSDLWPTRDEVAQVVNEVVTPALFTEFYSNTLTRNQRWNNLEAP